MIMYLLYCGLLAIWVLLLWPVFRLKGGARLWLLVVAAAGVAALAYEIRMYLWSSAAIRLDILLISLALVCLYGSAAVLLFLKRWGGTAVLLAGVLVLIGGGMSHQWILTVAETQRLGEILEESNRLLFRSKFRSRDVYESHFGPFTGAADHPVGHWRIWAQSHFTRLIINAEGRVWLFYRCQEDAECHSGPQGSGLRKSGDQSGRWEASLKPQAGLPFDIAITETAHRALSLEVRGQSVDLTEAPPPLDNEPAPHALRFLDTFAKVECLSAHATVRQVWLWEDSARRYAVGIFATLIAGLQHDFIRPVVMGAGVAENGLWRFAWEQDGRSGTAAITFDGSDVILTLDLEGRDLEDADRAVLKAGGIFSDERITLAPLTSDADWRHWFDTVLVGHFASGDVPAC